MSSVGMSLPFRKPHICSAIEAGVPGPRARLQHRQGGRPGGHRRDRRPGGDVQLLAQQRASRTPPRARLRPPPSQPGATCCWIVLGSSRRPQVGARASISRHPLTEESGRPDAEIEIAGRTAAVTGAGGFIGGAVCRALADAGASEVVGIDVSSDLDERIRAAGATPRVGERRRPGGDRGGARGRGPGRPHGRRSSASTARCSDFIEVNVRGTANVLDGAEAAGAERVLHISSVVVYGYADERDQDESATRRAVGIPYIDTKSASDRLAGPPRRRDRAARGRLRPRVGPLDHPPGRADAPRAPRAAGQGRRDDAARLHRRPGRGDHRRAAPRGARARPTRSGTAAPVTFQRYFELLAAEVPGATAAPQPPEGAAARGRRGHRGRRAPARPAPAFGRHGVTLTDRRGTASNARAREELGWEPEVGLDEGIARSGEWLRELQPAQ